MEERAPFMKSGKETNQRQDSIRAQTARALLNLTNREWSAIVDADPHAIEERERDLIRIARALVILLPRPNRQAEWLRVPNRGATFDGMSALKLIQGDVDALKFVRLYLEAELER